MAKYLNAWTKISDFLPTICGDITRLTLEMLFEKLVTCGTWVVVVFGLLVLGPVVYDQMGDGNPNKDRCILEALAPHI